MTVLRAALGIWFRTLLDMAILHTAHRAGRTLLRQVRP